MGEGRAEGAQIGRVVKSSRGPDLKLSCDADAELIRPCVECTNGHRSTERQSMVSLLVVTWWRAFPYQIGS
jgi:hypothetical protein|uniref:Vezf1 protein n=1 Tax=Mus musculus TaxID=10090 RepID=Q8K1B7_MOUSE|nr:Vezf1 protein [Mus musculus]